jgi:hypothetical protein
MMSPGRGEKPVRRPDDRRAELEREQDQRQEEEKQRRRQQELPEPPPVPQHGPRKSDKSG